LYNKHKAEVRPGHKLTGSKEEEEENGGVHPGTGYEGHGGEQRYISTLSLTLALDGGYVVKTMPWLLYPLQGGLVAIVQEAGWASGLVRVGSENLASTGIQSPDLPACRELLYSLSYPGSPTVAVIILKIYCMREAGNY